MPVIDFRVTLPLSEYSPGERAARERSANYLRNYSRVYTGPRGAASTAELLGTMARCGVSVAVLQAEWGAGDYKALNERVLRTAKEYSSKFVPFVTVNPMEDDDMAAVVRRAAETDGARGVNLQPYAYRLHCSDRRFYPLYERCQDLGLIVAIHCSVNFAQDRSIDYGRPLHLDQVACDFPELTLIANHAGWPWVLEMIAVAWKHPKVYLELGAISPKYLARPGTGWEPLLAYGSTLLADRILWATDSMLPMDRSLGEMMQLPLADDVKRRWVGENAARLLGV